MWVVLVTYGLFTLEATESQKSQWCDDNDYDHISRHKRKLLFVCMDTNSIARLHISLDTVTLHGCCTYNWIPELSFGVYIGIAVVIVIVIDIVVSSRYSITFWKFAFSGYAKRQLQQSNKHLVKLSKPPGDCGTESCIQWLFKFDCMKCEAMQQELHLKFVRINSQKKRIIPVNIS